MHISLRKGLLLLLCCLTASPAVAAAQDDEVFVDPGSPSGKEYAIPIDRARQEGSSTRSQAQKGSGQKAPLFGEGVEGRTGSATARAATSTDANSVSRRSKGAKARAEGERRNRAAAQKKAAAVAETRLSESRRARTLRAQAAAPEGGTGVAAIIGAGLGVLLVGGLVGLWLRRRATP